MIITLGIWAFNVNTGKMNKRIHGDFECKEDFGNKTLILGSEWKENVRLQRLDESKKDFKKSLLKSINKEIKSDCEFRKVSFRKITDIIIDFEDGLLKGTFLEAERGI